MIMATTGINSNNSERGGANVSSQQFLRKNY